MKLCVSVLAGLVLLSGCSSPPDDGKIGKIEFYEWFRDLRARYAEALDGGRDAANAQAVLAQTMRTQIDKRYDSIVERAATEQDASKRELAVSALGFSGRPEAAAHIESHLNDPTPAVRGTAVAAIGILNPAKPPMEKIEALLADPDLYVRQAALFSIKNLAGTTPPSKAGLAQIHKLAIEDAEFAVRNEAVLVLGRIKNKDSVDTLRSCLGDENSLVRGNAAQVLAGFDPRAARLAVPALIERLKDGETGVVRRAHFALKAITGLQLDPQYASWLDWANEISKVLEYYCEKDKKKSDTPGVCPDCGLPMEPRAIPEAEFACPEHSEVTSRKPGKCYKCQKELLPQKKADGK